MAFYLVRAEPSGDIGELRRRLDDGDFEDMRPFGESLTESLENARFDAETREAVWEEEDYCTPPLRQERDAVLDDYFDGITVEEVDEGEGWDRIDGYPSLWEAVV